MRIAAASACFEVFFFPPQMELRASYKDCLQEVLDSGACRREVLLFQVDCLQDALEGTEEMLAVDPERQSHSQPWYCRDVLD